MLQSAFILLLIVVGSRLPMFVKARTVGSSRLPGSYLISKVRNYKATPKARDELDASWLLVEVRHLDRATRQLASLAHFTFAAPNPIDLGAKVAERLARSPPTKANRFQSPAGSPDFRKW
ncbi:hypothetical protein PR048_028325 [Dryococelus australis]|uniref:Secreted protein n=1 Tax=Dryococelus australis TaxID=614101 RepID=A0ABQ9GJ03_9NEOP|nr:hypothetical protein PR048_028325 [Dryococelus australis]